MARHIGAEILGRAPVDPDREQHGISSLQRSAHRFRVQTISLDDRDTLANRIRELRRRPRQHGHLSARLEALLDTFPTDRARGAKDCNSHG